MNVCMLSMKGNFDKNLGQGVQAYNYQIWNNLRCIIKYPDHIEKVELGYGSTPIARKTTFTIAQAFYDFSKYDIIHMPSPIMFNPRGKHCTVTTLHELFLLEKGHPLLKRSASSPRIRNPVDSFIGKSIRRQIMGSDYLLPNSTQTFLEAASLGYPKDRMFTINLGIDDKFSKRGISPAKRKIFTVGYLGSIHARKNVQFAVKAFMSFNVKSARFEIWGKLHPGYESLVQAASTDKRIRFRGPAPEEKKADIYSHFDVFLFPSLYEGFGFPILEAQAIGIPVIICKWAKIPKEVRRYCFEAEDEVHMARIIDDIMKNGYKKPRRDSAARYARSFTWEKCARETLNAYREISKREG